MHRRTITMTVASMSLALAAAPIAAVGVGTGPEDERTALGTVAAGADEDVLRGQLLEASAQARSDRAALAQGSREGTSADLDASVVPTSVLDTGLDQLVAEGAVGVSAEVETPDLAWSGSAGTTRLGGSDPALTIGDFRAASNTKMMVATLVMQEVENGTWTLDTLVDDIIPGLFPDHPEVTIRHLLGHTSGAPLGTYELITPYIADPTDWDDFLGALNRSYTDQEHVDAVNAAPWTGEPGTAMTYSNAGYVALGMLLEEVNDRSVSNLVRERVLRPTGLRNTSLPTTPDRRGSGLQGAMFTEQGWFDLPAFDPDVFSHSGSMVTTTTDLNDFTEALMSGELVEQTTVDTMLTPSVPNEMNYGLGVYAIPDPCTEPGEPVEYLYGHDGATFGTLSLAFSSRDGSRQFSLGVTGRDLTATQDGLYDINDALVPLLLATC